MNAIEAWKSSPVIAFLAANFSICHRSYNFLSPYPQKSAMPWGNTAQLSMNVYFLIVRFWFRCAAIHVTRLTMSIASDSSCPSVAPEPVILSATAVVKLFVLPHLMKRTHVLLMLKILHRYVE